MKILMFSTHSMFIFGIHLIKVNILYLFLLAAYQKMLSFHVVSAFVLCFFDPNLPFIKLLSASFVMLSE